MCGNSEENIPTGDTLRSSRIKLSVSTDGQTSIISRVINTISKQFETHGIGLEFRYKTSQKYFEKPKYGTVNRRGTTVAEFALIWLLGLER